MRKLGVFIAALAATALTCGFAHGADIPFAHLVCKSSEKAPADCFGATQQRTEVQEVEGTERKGL
jgi:hypothetical protein